MPSEAFNPDPKQHSPELKQWHALAGKTNGVSALAVGEGHDPQWLLGLPVCHICIPGLYFSNGARVEEEILKADELPFAECACSREEAMKMVPRDFYYVRLGHAEGCNESELISVYGRGRFGSSSAGHGFELIKHDAKIVRSSINGK